MIRTAICGKWCGIRNVHHEVHVPRRRAGAMSETLPALLREIRACRLCAEQLPLGPRPVLQAHGDARILIASQAPGHKVHESGMPLADARGERLRSWPGLSRARLSTASQPAILPRGCGF